MASARHAVGTEARLVKVTPQEGTERIEHSPAHSGCRVSGVGCRVSGVGCRVSGSAENQALALSRTKRVEHSPLAGSPSKKAEHL